MNLNNKQHNNTQQSSRIGILLLLLLIGISRIAIGQSLGHSRASLKEGEILFLCNIIEDTDVNGKEVKFVQYQAITIANISMQSCMILLKETSLHKDLINNAIKTEKIEFISENEWLNYYSFKGRGKIADYDCILKVKYFGSHDNKSFAVTGTAHPVILDNKGLERIESYNVICAVRELENKKVEISIFMELVPNVSIPDWKIKLWYPDPVFVLQKIIDAARSFQSKFNSTETIY